MALRFFVLIAATLIITSCNSSADDERPDDAFGTGRQFIESSLKGNYHDAKKYLLQDSLNLMYFDRMEEFYSRMSESEKAGYREANIIINPIENVSDSIAIINYSNTFKKEPAKIKLVRINEEWWVDFKYSFSGNL